MGEQRTKAFPISGRRDSEHLEKTVWAVQLQVHEADEVPADESVDSLPLEIRHVEDGHLEVLGHRPEKCEPCETNGFSSPR